MFYYTQSPLALCYCLILWVFQPRWRLILACCLGYGLGFGHQWWTRDQGMPQQAVISKAILSGVIANIPNHNDESTKFELNLKTLNKQPVHARVQLGCYRDCPVLHAGQHWTMRAKLHLAHSLNNPGGFDYTTYLAAKHIHWVGYVLRGSMHRLPSDTSAWQMVEIRETLADHLAHLLPDVTSLGIAQALTIGVTTHISQASWTLFRSTGTTHLMVISGAHIGLVAGMIFKGICFVWARFTRLCLRYPAQKIGSIAAILGGFGYAILAGFGVPAERSAVAACFIFLRYLGQRQFSAWQAWRYALLAVLWTEPHAVWLPGFYLSFMAVAILLTMNQRIRSQGIRKALWIQVSCMLGLLPFTVFWFAYGAVNGLLANLVAIPWVSFVVVPLALICLGLGQYLSWLPKILHYSIQYLLLFLHWVDSLAWINLKMAYANVILPVAGVLGLSLSLFLPVRRLLPIAITCFIVALYPNHPRIPQQTFQAHILDVGQGLAVVILTQSHALIYDTGGQIYHGSDMGKLVILPYFQHIGLRKLDKIIISHPDLDHRGGLASLQTVFPETELIVDDPSFYQRSKPCHRYPDWTWEGIHFHFFPLRSHPKSTNNRSCVLQISNKSGRLLLTGDIEHVAEQELIHRYGAALHANVLVVPHHGSQTSSSWAFLKTVAPDYAVLSYGFDNRYHFPHRQIMQRYRDLNIPTIATAEHGMIQIVFQKNKWKIVRIYDTIGSFLL
ncbi:MAG: DNA internalization-related competence protein ComEC/Rec2 [Legionellales bacterium]|nr:DNA internalization-related competence protein ComEC/Rec2 [Legionellales bacterium]